MLKDFVVVVGAEKAPGLSTIQRWDSKVEPIRGVRFQAVEDISEAVSEQLKTLQKNGPARCSQTSTSLEFLY